MAPSSTPIPVPTIDPKKKQEQNWKARYGMTRRAYDRLLKYQNGVCAVCGGPPDTEDNVLAIDHDHETGKVRGLLCKACNTALGNAKDDPERLARLRLYVETHTVRPAVPAVAGETTQGPSAVLVASGGDPVVHAPDPRIPTPEVIAALKGHGLTEAEIAEEFALDKPTVHSLLTEAQRSSRVERARDLLMTKGLPHALATIVNAAMEGDAKTSVALVKGLGVLRDRAEAPKETRGTAVNFETWRASLTVERFSTPVDPEACEPETLDAEAYAVDADGGADRAPTGAEAGDPGGRPLGHLAEGPRPEAPPAAPAGPVRGFRTV